MAPDYTSSNQRLWSAFDDLDPRLSLFVMSSTPAKKSAGDARCASQDPLTHDKFHKISTQIRIRSAFFLRRTQSWFTAGYANGPKASPPGASNG